MPRLHAGRPERSSQLLDLTKDSRRLPCRRFCAMMQRASGTVINQLAGLSEPSLAIQGDHYALAWTTLVINAVDAGHCDRGQVPCGADKPLIRGPTVRKHTRLPSAGVLPHLATWLAADLLNSGSEPEHIGWTQSRNQRMLQGRGALRCGQHQQRGVIRAVPLRTHMRDTYPLAQPQQHGCRPCSRMVQCRVFDKFKDILGGRKQQQASSSSSSVSWEHPEDQSMEEEEEGAEMVPLDLDSRGGLGGTSEDVLGPLVRSWLASLVPMQTLLRASVRSSSCSLMLPRHTSCIHNVSRQRLSLQV
jgi:hypothetical protein